jgi:hypothetical protein
MYLDELSTDFFNSPTPSEGQNSAPIDYYRDTNQDVLPSGLTGEIGLFFRNLETNMGKIDIFEDQLFKFDRNRSLLNMRNIIIPKQTFFYEKFETVLITIINIIEETIDQFGNLIYDHEQHLEAGDPVIDVLNSIIDPNHPRYDPNEPKNNAMDIIENEDTEFDKFIGTPLNPYSSTTEPNKFRLHNEFYLPEKRFDTSVERDKYDLLFGNLNPQTLYQDVTQIDVKYNGFLNERDVYRYMKDIIIQASTLNPIFDVKEANVQATFEKMVQIITDNRQENQDLLDRLTGVDGSESLIDQLESTLNGGQPAKFSWIKYIGHYLIEFITIRINDQIIDKQTGEWMHFLYQLTKKETKKRGYNKLIGNVPELTDFTEQIKRKYQLKIPLNFWFNRNVGGSIPLVALPHSDIEILVKLKDFDEVSYFEPFTEIKKKVRLSGHMIAEYIYVEADERNWLAKNKLEYLIEQVQTNGKIIINKNSLNEDNMIRERLFFENPCKELFWGFQRLNFIDGSMINGERKYHNYSSNFETEQINPLKMIKIEFNSRDREIFKESIYYDKIVPYARHYSTPSDGINNYSFSLRPELPTPNGSANLSKLDDVVLNIIPKDFIIEDMKENSTKYRFPIYTLSYNILRIFSGLAGLVFFK